ncbi:MAG: hypothetical protein ACLSAH_00235 [Bilophila wadsworthia]
MFRVLSLALVACLLMAGSAFADMKIGVFNSQAVAMDSDAARAAQQKLQSQFGAEKTQQGQGSAVKGEALRLRSLKCPPRNVKTSRWNSSACAAPLKKVRNFARKVENTENQIRQSMAQRDLRHRHRSPSSRSLILSSTPLPAA